MNKIVNDCLTTISMILRHEFIKREIKTKRGFITLQDNNPRVYRHLKYRRTTKLIRWYFIQEK